MKFFAVFALILAVIVCVTAHQPYKQHTPVKVKRCETVTTIATKYSKVPVVKTTYSYVTHTTKVPSVYETYITTSSSYVDYKTVCHKNQHQW